MCRTKSACPWAVCMVCKPACTRRRQAAPPRWARMLGATSTSSSTNSGSWLCPWLPRTPFSPGCDTRSCHTSQLQYRPAVLATGSPSCPASRSTLAHPPQPCEGERQLGVFPSIGPSPASPPLFPWPNVLRARSFADAVHGSSFSSDTSLPAPLASQKAGHGPADHTSLPWKFFPGARLTQRDKSSLHGFNHCSALDILECSPLSGRPFHSLLRLLSHSPLAKQQSDARRHKGQSKPEMWHFTRG